jgi:uridine phosphorylase
VSTHLRPSGEIAADALLPGDPGRALALAQGLLERPLMSNHARGLWGYFGRTAEGRPLTIQATGIGGPSAAIVLEELATLGVSRAIRLGTCAALDDSLDLGARVVAQAALPGEGASRALGAVGAVEADPGLTAALAEAAGPGARLGLVASTDLFYDPRLERNRADWLGAGAVAAEMGSATLLALGRRLGVAVASGLVVTRRPTAPDAAAPAATLDDERLEQASIGLGRAAALALGSVALVGA